MKVKVLVLLLVLALILVATMSLLQTPPMHENKVSSSTRTTSSLTRINQSIPINQSTQSVSMLLNGTNVTFFVWKGKIVDCDAISVGKDKIVAFLRLITPTRINKTMILSVMDHSLHLKNLTMVPWDPPRRVRQVRGGFFLVGPNHLIYLKGDGTVPWILKGNFTDAVRLHDTIYALEFIGNKIYLTKIDLKGRVRERTLVSEISHDTMEKLKYFYKRGPPTLLTDGHYLYAIWADLVRRETFEENESGNITRRGVLRLAKFYANGSIVYTRELVSGGIGSGFSAILLDGKIVLSVWSFNCHLIFVERDGRAIARVKNPVSVGLPTSFGCWGGLRNFGDRLYHFGWYSMIGFLDLIKEDSLIEEVTLGIQENNAVGDVYLRNGTLYVCGLVQGPEVNGAFIAKVDPDLREDLDGVLVRALKQRPIIEVDKILGRR